MRSGHTSRELWSLDLNTLTWERVETNQVRDHSLMTSRKNDHFQIPPPRVTLCHEKKNPLKNDFTNRMTPPPCYTC